MPKQVTITPEVREVLAGATVEGTASNPVVLLNAPQLDHALYNRVDNVLRALGGRWDRKAKGHRFDRPVEGELAEALRVGVAIDAARTAEQFFTPPAVARLVFATAELSPYEHVLEPSAGRGALLVEPIRCGCEITAVEQDQALALILAEMLETHGCNVARTDFLAWTLPASRPPIDVVLMNPPFGRGKDMDHVLHALDLLRPGGRLVAIMSPHWTFGADNRSIAFRGAINEQSHRWEPLPAKSFRSAGTDVETGILTIRKGNI